MIIKILSCAALLMVLAIGDGAFNSSLSATSGSGSVTVGQWWHHGREMARAVLTRDPAGAP